ATSEIRFPQQKAPPVNRYFAGSAFHYELWVADMRVLVARTAAAEAATPTAAATPATETAATPAAEASASILTRLSFVRSQTATVEFCAIEFGYGGLTF